MGGHLAIESLQDTATYRSRNASAGFSLSLSVPLTGGSLSGSVSAGSSRVESDYRSVNEQSALRAGDGGFDVAVQGNTVLTGGAITSSQAAVELDRNRFATGGPSTGSGQAKLTLTDIHNKADYAASSASLSLGAGLSLDGRLAPQGTGAGLGRDAGQAESTTLAAISGVAGNTAARTGDAETGIAPIFDANRVQREIEAQARITQMFGQSASKAVGDYAQTRMNEAKALRELAQNEPDESRASQLEVQADAIDSQWGETGTLRLIAHALIGGLTGGASGAAGAAVGTLTAPLVAEALANAGIDGPLATAITGLASTAAGAAVGGSAGAATALNEVGNNYLDHRKPNAATLSEKERYERAAEECRGGNDQACGTQHELAARSARRDALLQMACSNGPSVECSAVVREARAMGNRMYGNVGELVWANSPDAALPLNVATIGAVPASLALGNAFHYQQASNLSQGLPVAGVGVVGAGVAGPITNITEAVWNTYRAAQASYNLGTAAATGAAIGGVGYTTGQSYNAFQQSNNFSEFWSILTRNYSSSGLLINMGINAITALPTTGMMRAAGVPNTLPDKWLTLPGLVINAPYAAAGAAFNNAAQDANNTRPQNQR